MMIDRIRKIKFKRIRYGRKYAYSCVDGNVVIFPSLRGRGWRVDSNYVMLLSIDYKTLKSAKKYVRDYFRAR